MSSVNAPRFLTKDGVDRDLALTMAWGIVQEQFYQHNDFFDDTNNLYTNRDVSGGKSFQWEWLADMPEAEDHVGGEEMVGQDYAWDKDTVALDKPVMSHRYIPRDEEVLAHWDVIAPLVRNSARKVKEKINRRIAVTAIKAAYEGALTKDSLTVHNGGNVVERVNASGVAAAYPRTQAGALAFRTDVHALAEAQDSDNVPEEGRFLKITPYMHSVLQQDTTLFDRDLSDAPKDMHTRLLGRLAGYWLSKSNTIPSTNITASTEGISKYRGDFTYNGSGEGQPVAVALCGAIEGSAAIGMATRLGPFAHIEFDWKRFSWFVMAGIFNGMDIMHPQCAGVIRVDDA